LDTSTFAPHPRGLNLDASISIPHQLRDINRETITSTPLGNLDGITDAHSTHI
jgi:hypothetical protein